MQEESVGTINQPKPSEPKSPVADQPPLQPGGASSDPMHSNPSTRTMPEADDVRRDELDKLEEAARKV